jgi:thiol-disulfide isomerase/thioredoxin
VGRYAVVLFVLAASPAWAERVQVFSIQGADCGPGGEKIKHEILSIKGVSHLEFDTDKAEIRVHMADDVSDAAILGAVKRAGFAAQIGGGRGHPKNEYPLGTDLACLTGDGSAVGPLERLRAVGRYTVFDIYADWCAPCRLVDVQLRKIVATRKDVAIRKLNIVDFDTPLGRELDLDALPHLVVFSPAGRRTEIDGTDFDALRDALKEP